MEQSISAADANRKFSSVLRSVEKGGSYVITSHGKPVAKIVPVGEGDAREKRVRAKAHEVLMKRLRSQPAIDIGPWTREELYEDVL